MRLFMEIEKPKLYVKDSSSWDIYCHKCPCGRMNVHGGWQQVKKTEINKEKKYVQVEMPCDGCGVVLENRYRLTTGKSRPRMIDWFRISLFIMVWTPKWLWAKDWYRYTGIKIFMWLERRLPL